jgi:chemosensory pili system protein ChpA (sensor histidine kinase/response regulator)
MAEAFDIGPLSWVKDEINQSLKKVHDSFVLVNDRPEEFASLRFSIAHLYQVSGALDMVGLEGCKRFCAEIEKLTGKLEKQQIPVTATTMAGLIHAIDTLLRYLQDLLNGVPDSPTRLYDSLKPLVELQGETLDVSDLFFPDVSYSAPKDLPTNPIAESAVPIFIAEQRSAFEKALLDWFYTKASDSLSVMRTAMVNVQQVQQKPALKTLWWAATAFIDALAQDQIAEQAGAKKLCRRLDQQLRNMSLGEMKVSSQLLRNILYYVALSDSNTDIIANVKDVFELDNLLFTEHKLGGVVATATERAALAQMNADLPSLKDLWVSISNSSYLIDLEEFNEKIDHLTLLLQSLHNQYVLKLINVIQSTAHTLRTDKSKIDETSLMEMAASLNLLEYIGEYYQQLDDEAHQKISTQTARLQHIVDGVALISAAEAFSETHLDASVVGAVAKQIIAALQLVEKALDTFFRNPTSPSILDDAIKPLLQISAAFDMLEMPTPKSIVQLSSAFVEYFRNQADSENQQQIDSAHFELVAESLSMLGLYAEELPNVRSESELALSGALQRLEQGILMLDLSDETSAIEVDFISASIDEAGGEPQTDNLVESTIEVTTESTSKDLSEVTDKTIDAELQDIFLTEAEEVLAKLAQNIQALRVNATDSESLAEVRRAYHTLKGSGLTVGLVGMSDVAWSVEKLLNLVIEHDATPTTAQLAFVENVSSEFATWVAELQANQVVTLNPALFQQRATELALEFEQALAEAKAKPQKEEVLIGGTRKLSRAFFNIFLAEAQQHLETLKDAQLALIAGTNELPSDASCRAAHTLGSNALTAGFTPTGDLARALEHWLDEHVGTWTEQYISLYGNVVKALEDGLEKAKALKNPKSTRTLILALSESTAAMQALATQQAEAAVLEVAIAEKTTKKTKSKESKLVPNELIMPALEPVIAEPNTSQEPANEEPDE